MTDAEPAEGRFIVLEGPDGAGKSVQARLLAERLRERGLPVTYTREPGGTELGEQVRQIVLDPGPTPRGPMADVLLYNAARAQHVSEVIRPALERGDIVVCDRYATSTMAYQGYGSGVDRERARHHRDAGRPAGCSRTWWCCSMSPSRSAWPGVPPAASTELTRFEDESRHDLAFHQRVRDGYLEMAAADPDRWVGARRQRRHRGQVAEEVSRAVDAFLLRSGNHDAAGNVAGSVGRLGRRLLDAEDGPGAARLGLGQGCLRGGHQLGAGGAIGGMVHHRGADADVGVADGRQLGDGIAQSQGHDAAGIAGRDDHELVLAEAGHGIEQSDAVGDGAGHVAQHLVGDARALGRR